MTARILGLAIGAMIGGGIGYGIVVFTSKWTAKVSHARPDMCLERSLPPYPGGSHERDKVDAGALGRRQPWINC